MRWLAVDAGPVIRPTHRQPGWLEAPLVTKDRDIHEHCRGALWTRGRHPSGSRRVEARVWLNFRVELDARRLDEAPSPWAAKCQGVGSGERRATRSSGSSSCNGLR